MVGRVGVCIERLFAKMEGWYEAGGVVDDEGVDQVWCVDGTGKGEGEEAARRTT